MNSSASIEIMAIPVFSTVTTAIRASGLRLFPLKDTLKDYSVTKAKADVRAALNVALLDFPQAMAYALIAGLPVQLGIYCSVLSSITGPILASSRFVMLGPTNATAVMLLSAFLTLGYDQAQAMAALPVLLLMISGFMILGAFCKVASIVQYVSRSVVTGYITAAACLIIVNQLKTVCGLDVERAGTFLQSLIIVSKSIHLSEWSSLMVAGITLAIYLPLKRYGSALPTVAMTLALIGIITEFLLKPAGISVAMLGGVSFNSWPLTLPSATLSDLPLLANTALAIAFLSLLESASIAKTLAAQAGDRIDLNQQMLSMGLSNAVGAFGSGMSVSGSLTRSVLNFNSGALTSMSSIFSGLMMLAGLILLGPAIAYVPKPALAALVITVGVSLINREHIQLFLKTTKSDASVFFITLGCGLVLSLDTAIYVGTAASIVLFIRKAAHPQLKEIAFDDKGALVAQTLIPPEQRRPSIAIVHIEGDMFFASCDMLLEQMRNLVEHPEMRIIVLRTRNAHALDGTAAMAIRDLMRFARSRGRDIIICGAHEEVRRVFYNSGLIEELGEENFFEWDPDEPNLSTRHALIRAQKILGQESADITIYATDKKK
jgi:SulP family sulfate permease